MVRINHETMMQNFIALGVALKFIKRRTPEAYMACHKVLKDCNEIIEKLRDMPQEKKKILNELFK